MSTLDAQHPVREDLEVCVAPIRFASGCRVRCPEAELLRATFHILVLCQGGAATQVVDFREVHHRPGSLLWMTPGTVHERVPGIEGTAVCFTSSFLSPTSSQAIGGTWQLEGADRDDVQALVAVLGHEYDRYLVHAAWRLLDGADVQDVALYLDRVISSSMGMRAEGSPSPGSLITAFAIRAFLEK